MTTSEIERITAPTEDRNPRTLEIDRLPTIDILRLINAEDATVPAAVAAVLPEVAVAVEFAVEALQAGRRVHYFGAGTSGRIAVLDASELLPTFAIDTDRVVAHLAGGSSALERAMEDVEDSAEGGAVDAAGVVAGDVAVGLSASGRTPYVAGALATARAAAAHTVLVSANPHAEIAPDVDVHIGMDTGPEALTGSTRMKAGTAQKLVLNAFSTAVMVRMGRSYSNLMVDVVASNAKLRGRLISMLMQATGADAGACTAALDEAGGEAKVALVCLLAPSTVDDARAALGGAGGIVRTALQTLATANGTKPTPNAPKENS